MDAGPNHKGVCYILKFIRIIHSYLYLLKNYYNFLYKKNLENPKNTEYKKNKLEKISHSNRKRKN
jgi:hypothetical protein